MLMHELNISKALGRDLIRAIYIQLKPRNAEDLLKNGLSWIESMLEKPEKPELRDVAYTKQFKGRRTI